MKESKVLLALVYLLALVSCQSAPTASAPEPAEETPVVESPSPVEPTPEAPSAFDSIQTAKEGFSPLAASPANTITFELGWSSDSTETEWSVAFVGDTVVRTMTGKGTVPTLSWDGRDEAGAIVAQGRYRATLSIQTISGLVEKASTKEFLVDTVPPSGTIDVTPLPYRSGGQETITFRLNIVSGGAPWSVWRLAVIHPDGRRFRDFISEENRQDLVTWDGRAVNNAALEPGTTYRIEAEVFDQYGNRGLLTAGLPVTPVATIVNDKPIEVSVALDGAQLAALPLWFAPYSADLETDPALAELNESSLRQLAAILLAAPNAGVEVVGHANQVLYADPAKAAYEQRETLLPLSLNRAVAVRAALIARGVSESRFEVAGVGALEPLAPFDDEENRWKNRRVVISAVTPAH